jgi:alanine dehydrogenase
MADFFWITEAEVAELVDMGEAIAALESGIALEADGRAENMVKTHAVWGGHNTLHAIGAVAPEAGLAATKTWAHTAAGATPLLILIDTRDGSLKAIIEAFALGQFRTGGVSGVATRWLAAPDADDMALIGTGKQAMTQLAAVAAVRPLRRVRVFSPNVEHRESFVARAARQLDLPVEAATSVEAATRDASIVTLVTRATAPFLSADMVARGAHLNAVGAITPERCEIDSDVLARCGAIVVDSPPQARVLSREFMDFFGSDEAAWARVRPLSGVLAARERRPRDADLTLFKAMGMGLSDLALGIEILRRAESRALGRRLPHPIRAQLNLGAKRSEPA